MGNWLKLRIPLIVFSIALLLVNQTYTLAEPGNTEVIFDVFNNGFSELTINDPDGIAEIERVDFDLTSHGCSNNVSPFGVLVPRLIIVEDCQNPRDVTTWLITDTEVICESGSCLPDSDDDDDDDEDDDNDDDDDDDEDDDDNDDE